MKALASLILGGLLPLGLVAQGSINNQGYFHVNPGTQVQVPGAVINESSTSVLNNDGKIALKGDWQQSNSNSIYTGQGKLSFDGQATQQLQNSESMTIEQLVVNNPQGLELNGAVALVQQLDLNHKGQLNLQDEDLQLFPEATIVNYDAQHFIHTNGQGQVSCYLDAEQSKVLPLGQEQYNPLVVQNQGEADLYFFRVEEQILPAQNGIQPIWYIQEQEAGGSQLDMSLHWTSQEEGQDFDAYQSAIYHLDQQAAYEPVAALANLGNTSTNQTASNVQQVGAFSVLSNKDLASSANEQPIALTIFPNPTVERLQVSFDRLPQGEQVYLQILGANGQQVFQQQQAVQTVLNIPQVADLPAGSYQLQVQLEDGSSFSKSFVKASH